MSTPFAYVIAVVVLLCFLGAAIVGIILKEGNVSTATPLITSLIGLFGPTVGVLVLIIRQQHNITELKQTNAILSDHLNNDTPKQP